MHTRDIGLQADLLEREADTLDDRGDPLRAAMLRDRASEIRARAQARRSPHTPPVRPVRLAN